MRKIAWHKVSKPEQGRGQPGGAGSQSLGRVRTSTWEGSTSGLVAAQAKARGILTGEQPCTRHLSLIWAKRAFPQGQVAIAVEQNWLQWAPNKTGKYIKEYESRVSHSQKRDLQTWKERTLE